MDQQTFELVARLIAVGVVLLVGFPVHEFAHALAAFRLGDSTARYMGRLTLDPRAHLDPLGAGILALGGILGGVFIGWAKPTPVNPINLEGGRRGESLVALAGPLSNIIMAALVAIPLRFLHADMRLLQQVTSSEIGSLVYLVVAYFVLINIFLAIFNLLPIPPLDGWKVMLGLVAPRTAYQLRQYEPYGFVALLFIFFFAGRILIPIVSEITLFLTGRRLL